jgi:ketosteroid isomerase-like protein
MGTQKNKSTDEAGIRQVIDGLTKALRAKDVNGVISNYAPDVLTFDIVPSAAISGERCL